MTRPIQYFSAEYLETVRHNSPTEVARFLEDFRRLHANVPTSRLISLRVPETLLALFRARCEIEGRRYQTRIKELMTEWVRS